MALQECIDCHGTGKTWTPCSTCAGRGIFFCYLCEGRGLEDIDTPCSACEGQGSWACSHCQGSGKDPEIFAPCPHCQGTGKLTEERFATRQAELEQARIKLEAEQRHREERSERRRRKDKNTLALFAVAAGGGLLGLVPGLLLMITATQRGQVTNAFLPFLLLALAGLAIGPALALQLYYGDTKRCFMPALTPGVGYGALGLIAVVVVTFIFTNFDATVITLLAVVTVVALIAVSRVRAAPGY